MAQDASTPAQPLSGVPTPARDPSPAPDAWNQIINSGPANRPIPAPPASPAASAAPAPTAGLTPEQIEQVKLARVRNRNITGAAQVARMEAWLVGIIGACALPFSITSPIGLLLALGMLAFCYSHLKAGAAIKALNPDAPRWLAINELALAVVIMLYAAWNLYTGLKYGSSITKSLTDAGADAPDVKQMVDQINTVLVVGIYGTMLVATPISQAAMGLYYYSRRKHLRRFLAETPTWIVQMQQAGGI